jgi:large subunit ribosomal protein L2
MAIKIVKSRGKSKIVSISVDYSKVLSGAEPYKPLLLPIKKAAGRNQQGRITSRFRANPVHRRLYRLVDFSRLDKKGIPAKVETIEYDPNRTAFLMRVLYADGERRYHLAPEGISVGETIICDNVAPIKIGNRLALKHITPGTEVYEVELVPQGKGKLARSAGSKVTILGFDEKYCILKMASSEIRKVSKEGYATVGVVSNIDHRNIRLGKAGRSRWLGRRPRVRGSAMNTRDHPYGGGKAKAPRGTRRPKTKWGKITGGRKTRKVRKASSRLILERRKKK